MVQTLMIYMAILSIWAFAAMGFDKKQAQKKKKRIPERNLWLLALLGGGVGAYFGMQIFRHKTRKTAFRIGFLLFAMLDVVILLAASGVKLPTSITF
ncbi:DUF1294 domain-containing protein [Sporosarcina newyorkensis]|uniref:Uncharacterized membrane protein YsdA, DUF1294 family n=1 Tax=Sporosarcina newyorkensis TaxID=759851 RepID=A0A1T4XQ80_9BACL|nr:DUF1294 domain-containing protein [Sporosarcina newyorkensis]SKA91697.1 Uncharacterized membrane protein YsdA, DUF1294 family [Sporosarcina newyorkensis]